MPGLEAGTPHKGLRNIWRTNNPECQALGMPSWAAPGKMSKLRPREKRSGDLPWRGQLQSQGLVGHCSPQPGQGSSADLGIAKRLGAHPTLPTSLPAPSAQAPRPETSVPGEEAFSLRESTLDHLTAPPG